MPAISLSNALLSIAAAQGEPVEERRWDVRKEGWMDGWMDGRDGRDGEGGKGGRKSVCVEQRGG